MASQIKVDQLAGAAGNTVTIPAGQTLDVLGTLDIDGGTLVLPNTVVTTTGTQTLTNKTLTNAVLTPTATTAGKIEFLEGTNNGTNKVTLIGPAASADVTVTLPAATDTLVGKNTTDTLTNKTVNASQLVDASIATGKLADDAVTTDKLADDAVTTDKLANAINSAITANTAKVTNATHSGEVTGATALTIANNIVDEANLKVSNSPTNGFVLSAQSGNTGGLTWVAAGGGDWVKLSSTTNGSAVGSFIFDSSIITTTHDIYYITGFMKPVDDNKKIYSQYYTGGSLQTSNYAWSIASTDSSDYDQDNGTSHNQMHVSGMGNASTEGCGFHFFFRHPMVSTIPTTFGGNFSLLNDNNLQIGSVSNGFYKALEANNGIKIYFSSGNIASGSNIAIYGLTK